MKKITLSDIAKKTGYSVNTVSHALRDMKDISKEVKVYINDTAKKMGYIPNISAGVLRGGKTMSVAVIVKDISAMETALIIKEIEIKLSKKGYSIFVMNTDGDEKEERSAITRALSQNVDGIIIEAVLKTNSSLKFLKESSVPFLFLGAEVKGIPSVSKAATISVPSRILGAESASMLLDMFDGKEVSSKVITPELIESDSIDAPSTKPAKSSKRELSDYLL